MKTSKNKQIRATAKQAVAEVLADETNQKAKIEELVETYETDLTEATEARAAVEDENKMLTDENEALRSEKKELETRITELEKEISQIKAEKETVEVAKKDLETRLSDMEQDAAMQKRVRELEEAELLSGGSVTDKLKARIKKMDEEEFADWKTELVSFKADWAKSAAQPVAPVTPEDTDATATADDDLDDLDPASPRVTAAQLLKLKKQIMASINVPSTGSDAIDGISDDVKKEYASMWDEKEDK